MRKISTLFCLLVMTGLTAYSQENPEPDTITWSIDLDDVVVTAQYAPTDSRSAVHRVRTIKRAEIEQRGVTNVEQLLRQELNIRVSQDMILGSSLNLQGISGQNVQIMIDGIPVIGRVGDDIDLGQVNLSNIERVEIIEGPLSVNYGTNALGGVINLITKKSQLHRYETQWESQWESVGRTNMNASIGIRPLKKVLLRFQGGGNQFQGYNSVVDTSETEKRTFQWNPKDQYFAGGSVRYDFAKDQYLRYAFNWMDEEVTNLGEKRRTEFKPYAFDDYYHTLRQDHSFHQEGSIGENFYLNTTLGYNYFKREKNTYRLDFDTDEESEVEGQQDTTLFNAYVFRPVFASKFPGGKINFQIGLDILYENGYGERIKDEESDKENFSELGDYALFGSLQYQPTRNLILQAGARAAHNTRFDAPIVPSLNIKYSPWKKLTVRASYAKGFRSPSLKELYFYFVDANHFILGNTDLQAETSDNFQLALDWENRIKKHRLGFTLKGFFNDIRQKIDLYQFVLIDGELVPAVEAGVASTQYAYFNQSRYKTLGSELSMNLQMRRLNLNLGFSPIGRYNLLSETDNTVSPFTFVYETNGEISYRIPKLDLQFSLYLRHNDKLIRYYQDVDEEGNAITALTEQDGFTLSDLTVSKYFWKKRIHLVGGAQNLFDVQNVPLSSTAPSGGGNIPVGMGRTWFVRLGWEFGWGRTR